MEDRSGNGGVVITADQHASALEGEEGRARRPTASLQVCRDSLRGSCLRVDCKFAHPLPTQPTQTSEEGKQVVTVCNDALRGKCSRGATCRFFHAPAHLVESLAAQVGITPALPVATGPAAAAAAAASAFGSPSLSWGGPSPLPNLGPPFLAQSLPSMSEALGPPPTPRVPTRPALEVCRDFVKGRCAREPNECRYAHAQPTSGNLVTVCHDFLKGRCSRDSCRYFHPEEHLRPSMRDIPVAGPSPAATSYADTAALTGYQTGPFLTYTPAPIGPPYAKRPRTEDTALGVPGTPLLTQALSGPPGIMDDPYFSGSLTQAYTAAALAAAAAALPQAPHPPVGHSLPKGGQLQGANDRLAVCRDFLKGKCLRPTCRFVHPSGSVEVLDNSVTVCRDATRGRCERTQCRFYHPPNVSSSGAES